jgi:hypothetical protein
MIVGLLAGAAAPLTASSGMWLSWRALPNLYVWLYAFGYSPAATAGDKRGSLSSASAAAAAAAGGGLTKRDWSNSDLQVQLQLPTRRRSLDADEELHV